MESHASDVERAVALLEANHRFPGPFRLRVVGRPDARDVVIARLSAVVDSPKVVSDRPSRKGRWHAWGIEVVVRDAHHVLSLYAELRGVDGVVAVL